MRVIFSRKGFDSSAGGCPSPVVDGRPCSLPIPTRRPTVTQFADLAGGLGDWVQALSQGRVRREDPCHLDPDLRRSALPRRSSPRGWRGSLGQEGAAQGHLAAQGVGPGDLFLFFGLFRQASLQGEGGLRFEGLRFEGPRFHALFGWLQVERVLRPGPDPGAVLRECPWLADHPHARAGWGNSNTIYVARRQLQIPWWRGKRPGWGCFPTPVRLTGEGAGGCSSWRVPGWLDPRQGGVGLSYHPAARWRSAGELQAAGRGQEFVSDASGRRDAMTWLGRLFARQPPARVA